MFFYNIRIAAKSLRRNPYLTLLLLGAIALGICVSTTFTTLRHAFAKDPLPGRSRHLFYVRMDNWDPATTYPGEDPKGLPPQLAYRDVRDLLKSAIPTHQTATFPASLFIHPDPRVGPPYSEGVRMVFGDFFTMFNVPFQYGGPWDKAADARPEPVIVIDRTTNDKLFGGANSVGRIVRIEDRNFKVAGVLADWRPVVRYYDVNGNFVAAPEAVYMPFNFTQPMQIRSTGNSDGWKNYTINTFDDFLATDVDWVQLWVELPTAAKQREYRDFVDSWVREQKKVGRFPRPLNNRLTDVIDLMTEYKVVQPQMTAMAVVSLLFLIVCSLNLVGLLLGKFLGRAPEVSVRRALGASRVQVFVQHVVECELVGVLGGAVGMLLSIGALTLMRKVSPGNIPLHLDAEMIASAIFLSLVAGLMAGVYPAWRICTMPPAGQLKLQ